MKLPSHVDSFTIAVYLAVLAACVYAYMILTVMRVVHFRNPFEMHFPRLWREHRTHFRDSKLRMILATLSGASITCFLASTWRS